MKQKSHHTLGAVLGYVATFIGLITLGLWFFADAENTMTAVGAATTIAVGALVITMSKCPSGAKDN